MESQRRKRQQINIFCPFVVSFVVHSLVIILMSVLFLGSSPDTKPPVLTLSFDDSEDMDLVELTSVVIEEPPSEIDSTQSQSGDTAVLVSEEVNIDIGDLETVEPQLEETIFTAKSEWLTQTYTANKVSAVPAIRSSVSHQNKSDRNGIGEGLKSGMKERLTNYGAGTGDVQISIAWDNYNDIDVWVVLRNGSNGGTISWMNRYLANGFLDIDKNVQPETNKAIENIFWPTNSAPYCEYTVYVQHYRQWDKIGTTRVLIRILVDGNETFKQITINPTHGLKKVHTFTRKPKKSIKPQNNQNQAVRIEEPNVSPVETTKDPYEGLIQQAPTFQ